MEAMNDGQAITPGASVIVVKEPGFWVPLSGGARVIQGLLGTAVRPQGEDYGAWWLVDFYSFGRSFVPTGWLALSSHVPPKGSGMELRLRVHSMNRVLFQFQDLLIEGGVAAARAEEIAEQAGWDGNNALHAAAKVRS